MQSIISGDSAYERYAKGLFTYISNDANIKTTIDMIDTNLASHRLDLIDIYLTMIDKFLDQSNDITKTTSDLGSLEKHFSDFSWYISYYSKIIQWYLIDPLNRLTDNEETISKINNGNGIKDKYDQIIDHVKSLARSYKLSLENRFKNFKIKIGNHKKFIEENIKNYIQRINESLNSHSSDVDKFIKSINNIESQIKKFETNYSKIGHISGYNTPLEIMKTGQPIRDVEIKQIFETLSKYRNALREFNIKKRILSPIMVQLKFYSDQFVGKTVGYDLTQSGSKNIDPVLNPLQNFKAHLDNFDKNMNYVQKLEEIGGLISTMKNTLKEVPGKVKPEAESYINGLASITITKSEVKSSIEKIKKMNESIIARLNITKHTIEFYNSLQGEISKLNGVTFDTHDFTQYLTSAFEVQKKVTSFDTAIKDDINKIKGDIDKINKNIFPESYKKEVEEDYTSDIPNIKSFIDNSLNVINVIKYLLPRLQDNKNRSVTYLDDIKSKVDGIKALNDPNKSIKVLYFLCII